MKSMQWITALAVLLVAPAAVAEEEPEGAAESTEGATAEDSTKTADTDADESDELSAVPDRPTFSAAAAVVPDGHAQLEAGGEFATTDGDSGLAFPVLVRVGIAEALELRAGLPAISIPFSDAPTDVGSVQFGGKIAGDVSDSLALGAMAQFDISASSGDNTVFSQSSYGFTGLWGYALSDSFGIGGNLGLSVGPGSTVEAGPRELFYAASLYAGLSAGDLGITLEGFTVLGQYADVNPGGSLSLGYAIMPNLICDAYAGASAQGGAATVFGGLGVTYAR